MKEVIHKKLIDKNRGSLREFWERNGKAILRSVQAGYCLSI